MLLQPLPDLLPRGQLAGHLRRYRPFQAESIIIDKETQAVRISSSPPDDFFFRLFQPADSLCRKCLHLLPKGVELRLVGAEFFLTVCAVQIGVRPFGKPFRMPVKGDLPAEKQDQGEGEQTPAVGSPDEEQGSEHHGIVPVVDPAGAAAFVFQEPGLEGTEEENADHIADSVGAADQDHDAHVEHAGHVQHAENAVEADPQQGHQHRAVVVLHVDLRLPGLDVIPGELLLAAGAFQPGGEKSQDHLHHVHDPDHGENNGQFIQMDGNAFIVGKAVGDIKGGCGQEENGTVHQSDKVKGADGGEADLSLFQGRAPFRSSIDCRKSDAYRRSESNRIIIS